MAKQDHIDRIVSYLGDGFVQFPAGTRNDLEANSVTIADLRVWADLAKNALEAIRDAGKLNLIPENAISSMVSNLEGLRAHVSALDVGEATDIESHFSNAVSQSEQLIYQVAPYLNLIDSVNYKNLSTRAEKTITDTEEIISTKKKNFDSLTKSIKKVEEKSQNILEKVSSGVLSENFGNLSNSRWNWLLMGVAVVISIVSFIAIVERSNELTGELIVALQSGKTDYRVFFAKWALNIPYLLLLSVGLLELRSRIRLRDIYLFRKGVAGSLDGYTEVLLNKAQDIRESPERSKARRVVIEFMINSLLELSKSPNIKPEKQRIGFKIKDIAEADVTHE